MMKRFIAAAAAIITALCMICSPVYAAKDYNSSVDKTGRRAVTPVHKFPYTSSNYRDALYTNDYYFGETYYFRDEAEIFKDNDEETKEIVKMIGDTARETGINVSIFLGGLYRTDSETKSFTQKGSEMLYGTDPDTNCLFLYLDFEGHSPSFDYIDAYHDARLYYTNSGFEDRIEDMIQGMYKYLPKSGQKIYRDSVKSAIESFLRDVKVYKEKGPAWEWSYYNEEAACYRYAFFGRIISLPFPPYKFFYVAIVVGVALGLIIGGLRKSSIRRQYKFREAQKASAYTSRNNISFNDSQDRFLTEHTSRVRLQSSSGGGGGGSFGGGGSHGGGGGHR